MNTRYQIAALSAVLVFATAPVRAQDQPATPFALKRDTPSAGTNLPVKIATSNFPLDKPYHRLTPEQVATLKSQYDTMGPNDEPPFPTAGLQSLVKSVMEAAGVLAVSGPLSAVATVGPDGKAKSVRVFQSPSAQMGMVVSQLMMVEEYKPAKCAEQACTMDFPLDITLQ